MLQIIAFGIGFLLFGLGQVVKLLTILATPPEKRKKSTGVGDQLFLALLGLIILALAVVQGFEIANLFK